MIRLLRKTKVGGEEIPDSAFEEIAELNAENAWTYHWDDLEEEDAGGNPYFYYIEEVTQSFAIETQYQNNGGIQNGKIVVINIYENYKLPETGGPGTGGGILSGLVLMLSSAALLLRKRRKEKADGN